mmetsp:Transcript_40830/g.108210  ORF Transcript_40830/g.108210 Transcript_40830/m.108210 type:complete len:96 (-) Transcript_40830:204-491(-)
MIRTGLRVDLGPNGLDIPCRDLCMAQLASLAAYDAMVGCYSPDAPEDPKVRVCMTVCESGPQPGTFRREKGRDYRFSTTRLDDDFDPVAALDPSK